MSEEKWWGLSKISSLMMIYGLSILTFGCGEHVSQFELANTDEVSTIDESGADGDGSDIDESVTAHPPVVLSGAYLACSVRDAGPGDLSAPENLSESRHVTCLVQGVSPLERSRISVEDIRNSFVMNGGTYDDLEIINLNGRLEIRFRVPAAEVQSIKDISVTLSVGSETVRIETVTRQAVEETDESPQNKLNSMTLDSDDLQADVDSGSESQIGDRQISRIDTVAKGVADTIRSISAEALSEVKTESQIEEIKKAESDAYEEIRVIESSFNETVSQLQAEYQSSVSKFNDVYTEKITALRQEAAAQIRAVRAEAESQIEKASSMRLMLTDNDRLNTRNRGDAGEFMDNRAVNEKIKLIWGQLAIEKEKLLQIKSDVQKEFRQKYQDLNLEKTNKIREVTEVLADKIRGIKAKTSDD